MATRLQETVPITITPIHPVIESEIGGVDLNADLRPPTIGVTTIPDCSSVANNPPDWTHLCAAAPRTASRSTETTGKLTHTCAGY